jgi:hypothetical protein
MRSGFLEEKILARLGYFPWQCLHCRARTWRKVRGSSSKPGANHNPGQPSDAQTA